MDGLHVLPRTQLCNIQWVVILDREGTNEERTSYVLVLVGDSLEILENRLTEAGILAECLGAEIVL